MTNDDHIFCQIKIFSPYSKLFNPQAPVAQKIADEVVFDVSKVKESIFLKSDLTDPPPQNLDAHLLENTDLSLSRFHFSVGFLSRSYFESEGFIAYSNE